MNTLRTILFAAMAIIMSGSIVAQDYSPIRYDIGSPTVMTLWVNPTTGNDTTSNGSESRPYRTVTAALAQVPSNQLFTTTGYRIMLARGTYSENMFPEEIANRFGSREFPFIIKAAEGRGSVMITRNVRIDNCLNIYLEDLIIQTTRSATDVLNVRNTKVILIRNCTICGDGTTNQDVLTMERDNYVFVEDNEIAAGRDNVVDVWGIHYGHFYNNKVHKSGDWAMNFHGGVAYFRVEANEIYDAGNGGFQAGSYTSFATMRSPWLHYEAYDLKFFNNIIHDVRGAAFGAFGAYNTLFAYNTAYKVGTRSSLFDATFGQRACDATSGEICADYLAQGGWGNTRAPINPTDYTRIPNKNVYVYNNIFYNPAGTVAPQHFTVPSAYSGPEQTNSNVPSPANADDGLVIRGNIIWNGSSSQPLGLGGANQGCANNDCNPTQVNNDNYINAFEPEFTNASLLNFSPRANGNILTRAQVLRIPSFINTDRPAEPTTPFGVDSNVITRDKVNDTRIGSQFQNVPGALVRTNGSAASVDDGITSGVFTLYGNGSAQQILEINSTEVNDAVLTMYDMRGTSVGTLYSGSMDIGQHRFVLPTNGTGMYIVVLRLGKQTYTTKVVSVE